MTTKQNHLKIETYHEKKFGIDIVNKYIIIVGTIKSEINSMLIIKKMIILTLILILTWAGVAAAQDFEYRKNLVKIKGNTGGSGVIVKYKGYLLVLTCSHVINGQRTLPFETSNGKTERAFVLYDDKEWDFAILSATGLRDLAWCELITRDIPFKKGAPLYICGWGPQLKNFKIQSGTLLKYTRHPNRRGQTTGDFLMCEVDPRYGDSGGPIYNKDGRLVGLVSTRDGMNHGFGPWAGRIGIGLNKALEPFLAKKQVDMPSKTPIQNEDCEKPGGT